MSTPSSSVADTATTASAGWHSIDKKRKERDCDDASSSWKKTLPLGWTRMQKSDFCPTVPSDVPGSNGTGSGTKRQGMMSSRNYYGDGATNNGSKNNQDHSASSSSSSSSSTKLQTSATSNNGTSTSINRNNNTKIVHGHAIFCLHDWNPSWIQGYFLPSSSSSSSSPSSLMKDTRSTLFGGNCVTTTPFDKALVKPWRMLGVQEEIDECLECADGGYRRLTLTVYHDTSPAISSAATTAADAGTTKRPRKKTKTTKFHGVEWTGGDMMDLYDVDNKLDMMKADKLLTGHQCLRPLNKYFGGLISHLRRQCLQNDGENGDDDKDDFDVLEFLPNLAIVIGSMSLTVPKKDFDNCDDVVDDLFDD
mmetsp:Transcript_29997/g.72794  ORF Transcript_29997/g.72794 Transcript_29997/m.72794 type:complete len:364 (+) Transcript_29997:108-1199(+)